MPIRTICLLFFILPFFGLAQNDEVGIGQWRVHVSYNTATSVTQAGNKIYAASPDNFFSIDKENNVEILSRITGLSDFSVSKVKYSDKLNLLVITYVNGNIDILKDGKIINISDIARKQISGSKKINHIEFYKNFAYLSTDFGLILLDCIKYEIKDSYTNLSPNGTVTAVHSSTVCNDSIYIATGRGLMAASNNSTKNLLDYNSWYTYGILEKLSASNVNAVASLNNTVFVSVIGAGVYYLKNGTTYQVQMPFSDLNYRFMSEEGDKIIVGGINQISIIQTDSTVKGIAIGHQHPSDALLDDNGNLWVALEDEGLFTNKYSSQGVLQRCTPNGPVSNFSWSLDYYDGKMVSVLGGQVSAVAAGIPGNYSVFENDSWNNFSLADKLPISPFDILKSCYDPQKNILYMASYSEGLIAVNADSIIRGNGTDIPDKVKPPAQVYHQFNETNSTLIGGIDPEGNSWTNHPFIVDMKLDSKGDLWVVAALLQPTVPSLHILKKNNLWAPPILINEPMVRTFLSLEIDRNDYKWLLSQPDNGYGILVHYSKDSSIILTSQAGSGGLPSNNVYCLAEDKKGQMWIGTNKGIAIFYDPTLMFNARRPDVIKPIYDGFPLLFDQTITAIEVDGGNRKWIGTTKGLWLFNEDGTKALLHFTIDNSPILSNVIKDIEIMGNTGEVFISTDKGIISYRGTATESDDKFKDVKVFPNPVTPDFRGTVGITGLATNASVKITDVFGNLVYETKSQGGMATWNVSNYNGKRAKSGIYLIFCSDDTATETLVSKISVIE